MPAPEMTALAGEPLPVEFCHAGTWYAAVLLGWRLGADGSCDVRVRLTVGGLRRTAWVPLADVRLVEPEPVPVLPAPTPGPRTRPSRLLPDRDWSRPLPPPGRPDEDHSRV